MAGYDRMAGVSAVSADIPQMNRLIASLDTA